MQTPSPQSTTQVMTQIIRSCDLGHEHESPVAACSNCWMIGHQRDPTIKSNKTCPLSQPCASICCSCWASFGLARLTWRMATRVLIKPASPPCFGKRQTAGGSFLRRTWGCRRPTPHCWPLHRPPPHPNNAPSLSSHKRW